MPLVPPRPLRPRKTIRGCRSLSRSAPRRSAVPLQRPLPLSVPSKLTRSMAGEGAGGAGSSAVTSLLPPPSVPLIFGEMLLFWTRRGGSECGAGAVAAAGDPRGGQGRAGRAGSAGCAGSAHCAEPSGERRGPGDPRRSCADPLGQTSSSARSLARSFKQYLPCWWFGFYYYYCYYYFKCDFCCCCRCRCSS